jgi:type IV pilus assembly protein PilM
MMARKHSLLPVGIHLEAAAVYMVQLEQTDGTVQVVSKAARQFASVPPPPPKKDGSPSGQAGGWIGLAGHEEARAFIREKIAADGFRGKQAVISIPADQLIIQHLRLAPVPPEEMSGTLLAELQGKLPYDPRKAVVRHIVAGQVSENNEMKQDVIILAIRRDLTEKHVAAMDRLGIEVVGVGVEPCSMCYPYMFAAAHAAPASEGPSAVMVVYLGMRATYVAIVRGQEMTFVKGVEMGTDHVLGAIAKDRNITPEQVSAWRAKWSASSEEKDFQEALDAYNAVWPSLSHITDEIESCMRYYGSLARGARIDQLVFVGPEAKDRALARVIGSHLSIAADVGDPLKVVMGPAAQSTAEPEMAVAVGLSLFGAQ